MVTKKLEQAIKRIETLQSHLIKLAEAEARHQAGIRSRAGDRRCSERYVALCERQLGDSETRELALYRASDKLHEAMECIYCKCR